MKRVGRILFCLLPLLITIGLQNLVSIPLCGISVMSTLLQNRQQGISLMELYNEMLSLWTSSSFTIGLSAFYSVTALVIFGFWYHKKLAGRQEHVPIQNSINIWIASGMLLLAIGLQYVTSYLMSFVGVLRPDWIRAYEALVESAGLDTLTPMLILYSCIIAPISEELIFRGVTLGYAKKAMPTVWAVCLQAVLFGIFHMNIIQGIYASFLGLFLGYICEAGGTIVIPMLLHAFFNFCGTFVNPYLCYHMEQPFFFLLWLTAGVLLTYAGIFLFQHGIKMRSQANDSITDVSNQK